MKLVKVARVGTKLKEVCLDHNATVFDALRAAGITVDARTEDIYLGHTKSNDTLYRVPGGSIIIVEPRKLTTQQDLGRALLRISQGMKDLIDFLDDEGFIDVDIYPDNDYDGEKVDYPETFKYHRDFLTKLIELAKKV